MEKIYFTLCTEKDTSLKVGMSAHLEFKEPLFKFVHYDPKSPKTKSSKVSLFPVSIFRRFNLAKDSEQGIESLDAMPLKFHDKDKRSIEFRDGEEIFLIHHGNIKVATQKKK